MVEEARRAALSSSARRRSRSRGGGRKARSRGRSRGREGDGDGNAAEGPQPLLAAQRGRRADASVKAAGMLSGSALVSELHKQNLGRMHVAPLLDRDAAARQPSGGDAGGAAGRLRQSAVSSSRTRGGRRHSAEPVARSYVTLEDFKGGDAPLPPAGGGSGLQGAPNAARASMQSGVSVLSRGSAASRSELWSMHCLLLWSELWSIHR